MDIGQTLNWLVVEPLSAGLGQLAALMGSSGLAIVMVAVFVRIVFLVTGLPDQIRRDRLHVRSSALSPEIEAIRAQHAEDRERRDIEVRRFYQEHGLWYKPTTLSWCLDLLTPLVGIFLTIGMYSVLTRPANAASLDQPFLWLCSLTRPDHLRGSCDSLTVIGAFGLPIPGPLPFLYLIAWIVFLRMPRWPVENAEPVAVAVKRGCLSVISLSAFILATLMPAGLVLYWTSGLLVDIVKRLAASHGLLPRPFLLDYD